MVSTTSAPEHAQGVNTSKLDALVTEFMLAEGLVEVCPACLDPPFVTLPAVRSAFPCPSVPCVFLPICTAASHLVASLGCSPLA